jgi:hypothetical protein
LVSSGTSTNSAIALTGLTYSSSTLNVVGNSLFTGNITGSTFSPNGVSAIGNGMYLPTTNELGFSTGGTEKLRILNNGNIGIGETSPSYKLDIAQSSDSYYAINISNPSARNAAIGYSSTYQLDLGATGTNDNVRYGVFTSGGGVASFYTSSYERMRITSGGNILMNTVAAPTTGGFTNTTLSVKQVADGLSGGGLHIEENATTSVAYFGFNGSVFNIGTSYRTTGNFRPITFSTNGYERLRIDNNGNVGIGTTSPIGKLHIYGDESASLKTYSGLGNTGGGDGIINVYRLGGVDNYLRLLDIVALGDDLNTRASVIRFLTTNTSNVNSEKVRIDGNGNVGIGTASPTARLSLGVSSQGNRITFEDYSNIFSEYSSGDLWISSNFYGNLGSSGYVTSTTSTTVPFGAAGIAVSGTGGTGASLNGVIKFFVDNAASKTAGAPFTPTERMRITSGGNVGIGTTSPSRKLIVYDTDSNVPTIGLRTNGSGILTTDGFDLQFASSNTFLFNRENGYMAFGTNNDERMQIASGGAVTINNLAGINDVGADANGKLQAATSDMNLKNTIENSPFGLNEILLLNPVTFLYNDTNRKIDSNVKEVGFIAQDVFDIIPYAVSSTGTGDLQLDYRAITATLVKAIQEQQALIKALEQRIINLENK